MRLGLFIFLSFSLLLYVQGTTSFLSDCLSLGNTCKMEMPAGSTCGCEHAGDLHLLPTALGDCPADCLNCNLEGHVANIPLALPLLSSTLLVDGASVTVVKMSLAEWSPDLLYVIACAKIDALPPHLPTTEWGVWRL